MSQSFNLYISTSYSPKHLNQSLSKKLGFNWNRIEPHKTTQKAAFTIKASVSDSIPSVLTSDNGAGGVLSSRPQNYASYAAPAVSDPSTIEVDAVTEAELKENGFRSTRRTKLICTIGPVTCGAEHLEALAVGGMNVARINMCHGTREWHRELIQRVRRLNEEKGYAVAIMMDTEGSEIHMGDLGGASSAKAEVHYKFNGVFILYF